MNSVVGIGKTIDQAIENALSELNATQDQVTIKVLSEGGLFKKAKVEVTLDEAEKKSPKVSFDEFEIDEKIEKLEDDKIDEKPIKPINKVGKKQAVVKTEKEEVIKEEKQTEKPKIEAKKAAVDNKTAQKVLNEIILNTLKYSKAENVQTTFEFDDRTIYVKIDGEKLGGLIGANGDTMNALESYINVVSVKQGITKRVRIDVGNYKQDRVKKLENMAEKAYQIAIKSGKYKFDPMPARDRRIIHTALQAKTDVTTNSHGTEPRRYVVVEKK